VTQGTAKMLKTSYLVHNEERANSNSIKLSSLHYAALCWKQN